MQSALFSKGVDASCKYDERWLWRLSCPFNVSDKSQFHRQARDKPMLATDKPQTKSDTQKQHTDRTHRQASFNVCGLKEQEMWFEPSLGPRRHITWKKRDSSSGHIEFQKLNPALSAALWPGRQNLSKQGKSFCLQRTLSKRISKGIMLSTRAVVEC